MGMFNKVVNKARSFFGLATPVELARHGGPRIRNVSPSLGQLYRERGRMYHAGHTLDLGRNKFKRACKAAGVNRVKAERAMASGMPAMDAFRYGSA